MQKCIKNEGWALFSEEDLQTAHYGLDRLNFGFHFGKYGFPSDYTLLENLLLHWGCIDPLGSSSDTDGKALRTHLTETAWALLEYVPHLCTIHNYYINDYITACMCAVTAHLIYAEFKKKTTLCRKICHITFNIEMCSLNKDPRKDSHHRFIDNWSIL